MIIKVEAIIREEKLQHVLDALGEMEVHGLTCYQVMGCGTQRGMKSYVRGHQEVEIHMLPKIKLEVLVSSEGKRKQWKRFKKQHILETLGTEKFSAMMYGMPCGFVPKKLGLEQFSRNK